MAAQQKVITVFGGTGFLGRHIVYALAKSGAIIRVATRSPQRAYFLRPAGTPGQVVAISCDVGDDASVAAAITGSTHVVNLIGVLFEKGKRQKFSRLHAEAPGRIARAARAAGAQVLVHVSALGANAEAPSKYARSKAEGENALMRGFGQSVILRPSIVFGPEDDFFNRFARMARRGLCLPLIGGGATLFQPVYVGDIARAVQNIITDPNPGKYYGGIYELAGPDVFSFRALMQKVLTETGRRGCLLSLPVPLAKIVALMAGILPGAPLLTLDQIKSLRRDNIATPGAPGLAELGVQPTALDGILPSYLRQYRRGGDFSDKRAPA